MDTLSSAPVAVNRRSVYADIDLHRSKAPAWPDGDLPKLTGDEAIRAAKRLWRNAVGKAWPGTWKAGRGNHRTHPRGTVFLVNPGQGWRDMVHDLSHSAYKRLTTPGGTWAIIKGRRIPTCSASKLANYQHVKRRTAGGNRIHHSDAHAELEREMIRMVIESGWLDGTLKVIKAIPERPDPIIAKHARILNRIKAWETKAKRAATALRKLRVERDATEAQMRRRVVKMPNGTTVIDYTIPIRL